LLRLGPLRLHWSLLLGALLFCAAQPSPVLLLGYVTVLLVHVGGHLLAVAGTPLRLSGVLMHALGGELLGEGEVSPARRSFVALSGVLAQLALLGAALWLPMPAELHEAFTRRNGLVLLFNLIPVKPLDGAQAWRLPARLRAASRLKYRGAMRSSRQVQKDVADLLKRLRR
jgi:stage IV sporulation protein FB